MPATLIANRVCEFPRPGGEWASGMGTNIQENSARCLTIGLINNMPDGALEATERQFLSLLDAASGSMKVRLVLLSLSGITRGEEAASRVRALYSGVKRLGDVRPDGIIVTGREPLAARLEEEVYWKELTRVIEWAKMNTYSSIWSCLAAHAAVLYCDGIHRVRNTTKQCGVFECTAVVRHLLTEGVGTQLRLPHSRWHGISERALKKRGYSVLTRSKDAGVDSFAKLDKSLFIYFQGHPEYESNSLLLEYRRDVARYLRAESNHYPEPPRNYFDDSTLHRLQVLQQEAVRRPRRELLAEIYATLLVTKIEETWRPAANRIYRNWLEYIAAQKQQALANGTAFERESMRRKTMMIARMGAKEPVRNVSGKTALG